VTNSQQTYGSNESMEVNSQRVFGKCEALLKKKIIAIDQLRENIIKNFSDETKRILRDNLEGFSNILPALVCQ